MAVVRVLVLWLVLLGIEVLLVGKFDVEETPVGAAVAALGVCGIVAALRASGERYRFRVAWLGVVPKLVANVVRDTLIVFGALLRRLFGGALPDDAIVELPFRVGGDDPEDEAHRALGIAAVSFAPNSIVLDLDRERNVLRAHYLVSHVSRPSNPEWPV